MENNDISLPNHRPLFGMIVWARDGRDIFLLVEIIQHLQVIGICTLNLIDNPDDTSLWFQGYRKVVDLDLEGNLVKRWDPILAELKNAYIGLTNFSDELI